MTDKNSMLYYGESPIGKVLSFEVSFQKFVENIFLNTHKGEAMEISFNGNPKEYREYFFNYTKENNYIPKQIIFSGATTIVFFEDGSKSVVRCADGEKFIPEVGVATAITQKIFGSRNKFLKVVNQAVEYAEKRDEKKNKRLLKKNQPKEENTKQN